MYRTFEVKKNVHTLHSSKHIITVLNKLKQDIYSSQNKEELLSVIERVKTFLNENVSTFRSLESLSVRMTLSQFETSLRYFKHYSKSLLKILQKDLESMVTKIGQLA